MQHTVTRALIYKILTEYRTREQSILVFGQSR